MFVNLRALPAVLVGPVRFVQPFGTTRVVHPAALVDTRDDARELVIIRIAGVERLQRLEGPLQVLLATVGEPLELPQPEVLREPSQRRLQHVEGGVGARAIEEQFRHDGRERGRPQVRGAKVLMLPMHQFAEIGSRVVDGRDHRPEGFASAQPQRSTIGREASQLRTAAELLKEPAEPAIGKHQCQVGILRRDPALDVPDLVPDPAQAYAPSSGWSLGSGHSGREGPGWQKHSSWAAARPVPGLPSPGRPGSAHSRRSPPPPHQRGGPCRGCSARP